MTSLAIRDRGLVNKGEFLMKKLVSFLLLLVLITSVLAGCQQENDMRENLNIGQGANQDISQTVYITRTGKKYHQSDCQYLRQSKIPVSLSEAIDRGYEPCSVCNPPELDQPS